ncbi:DUF456 domain-containing protein [Flavobacterium caeni]|uniref:DUF456 domain-containing protein n=1 Tax=Flavobacterium caeni TaxID=490189 RepID=A0A1G5GDT9_9FLAO|nr:DUF456 domain-containing protein [Flavobacterium caeni]SCY49487.1 hypothetical protein SAMN02927903_01533 [Flavobacterium caeni]
MDIALLLLGFCCVVIGALGSFLPVLPGPGLSWVGVLLLYCTKPVAANYWVLGITLAVTVALIVLDYVIPAQGTKRFGGSSYGIWGTNIGLIVGIFAPIPLGFLIGPFVGAFVSEMIYNSTDHKRALKAATGSFIGFLVSSFAKFVLCMALLGLFVVVAWRHRSGF